MKNYSNYTHEQLVDAVVELQAIVQSLLDEKNAMQRAQISSPIELKHALISEESLMAGMGDLSVYLEKNHPVKRKF